MLKKLEQHINQRYGSKRGWLNFRKAQVAGWLGRWRPYRDIDWDRVDRLVFICMGNICRSPLAERVALDAGYNAVSMGVNCTPDMPADPRAIEFACRTGYDLSAHRTTLLDDGSVQRGDLLIGMDIHHLEALRSRNSCPVQATLLGLWHSKPTAYIHDPYLTDEGFFEQCEQFVVDATIQILKNARHARREWKTSMH